MRYYIAIGILLLVVATATMAGDWKYEKRIRGLVGNNYIDFTEHKGKIYYATNAKCDKRSCKRGALWIQKAKSLKHRPGKAKVAVGKEQLAEYKDVYGTPMTYVRTVGIESDGRNLYVLMFVGAPYGSKSYYYAPALAVSYNDGSSWQYLGPANVNGRSGLTTRIFSSSSAFFMEDNIFYYGEDASKAFGYDPLLFSESEDGLNYTPIIDAVGLPEDKPVFPDAEACGGKYHLLYENGLDHGGDHIRHYVSDDLIEWTLLDKSISVRDYKGMNISCVDGKLYGLANKTLYRYIN